MKESNSSGARQDDRAAAKPLRRILRSIAAVVAGAIVGAVPAIATDMLMVLVGVLPPFGERAPDAALVLATAYRAVYSIAGGYSTARLAPDRPMRHAMILGALGLVVATAGAIATWNGGPAFEPKWYPLTLVALAVPCAWIGGKAYTRQWIS